jgi:hypothetical protein
MPDDASGVWSSDDRVGWYGSAGVWALQNRNEAWVGPDGAWFLGQEGFADVDLDGESADVAILGETWPEVPNTRGHGRAFLNRTWAVLRGFPGGECRYTAIADNLASSETLWSLSDSDLEWGDISAEVDPLYDDLPPVMREAVPRLSGSRFSHRLQAIGRMELVSMRFDYRGQTDA